MSLLKGAIMTEARATAGKRKPPSGWLDYLTIYRAAPLERIRRVKAGVSTGEAKEILSDWRFPPAAFRYGVANVIAIAAADRALRAGP